MLSPVCELKLKDFADMFGTTVDDISENCGSFIEKHNFRYRQLEPEERDKIILNVKEIINEHVSNGSINNILKQLSSFYNYTEKQHLKQMKIY